MPESASALILTLGLDPVSFSCLNQLRQQHFPAEKNLLPAHITLFHTLPIEQQPSIQQTLPVLCAHLPVFELWFPGLRFLGRGVALEVDSPQLLQLRQRLAQTWKGWLTRQDRQNYRPHVTIQNKTTAEQARQLYNHLAPLWQPFSGYGTSLLLWYYQGGPWELAAEFPLGDAADRP